jgi:hypothetical protein
MAIDPALCQILKKAQKHSQSLIEWEDSAINASQQLKRALTRVLALGLPTHDKFQLYVYEKEGLALGVVTQLCGSVAQLPNQWAI